MPATVPRAQLMVFALVYGIGYGAVFTLTMSKPISAYGRIAGFAKMQGFIVMVQRLGMIAGVALIGSLHELTGSFTLPFSLLPWLAALAAVHYIAIDGGGFVDVHGACSSARSLLSVAAYPVRWMQRSDWSARPNRVGRVAPPSSPRERAT